MHNVCARHALIVWVWFVTSLLTSCAALPNHGDQGGAATPEAAVRHSVLDGAAVAPEVANTFRIHGARPWEHGRIVLYSMRHPQHPAEEIWSYQFVEQGPRGWHATTGKGFSPAMFQQQGAIRFRIDQVTVAGGPYLVLFGQAERPATAVEVVLMDQQVVRDPAPSPLVLLLLPAAVSLQELRVVSHDGQVIERVDLSPQVTTG